MCSVRQQLSAGQSRTLSNNRTMWSMNCIDCNTQFNRDAADPMPARRCPDCRQRLLLSFRNERTLHSRTCDKCQRPIVSTYPADTPNTVYCDTCWWKDDWDGTDYAKPYDESRPFMDQLQELYLAVPQLGMNVVNSENSDYTNYGDKNKDCYILVSAAHNENVMYSEQVLRSKDSAECSLSEQLELCYWTQSSKNCYRTHYSEFCDNCTECWFCYDTRSSRNCFGSFGLRNAEYVFLNQQLTKQEYETKLSELNLHTLAGVAQAKQLVYQHWQQFPHRYANVMLCENTTGENVVRAKDSSYIFDSLEMENCHYCHGGLQAKDSRYCVPADGCENCYNCMSLWQDYNINCSLACWYSSDLYYCIGSMHSQDLFGCVGVRHKKYAILNTEYSKEEYETLRAKIVQELEDTNQYGEFFPPSWSPFAYNQTVAQNHYPLEQATAEQLGYQWAVVTQPADAAATTANSCMQCNKPFRITEQEQNLYTTLQVPTPNRCMDCRYQERFSRRNPRKLYERTCDHETCETSFQSSYKHDRPEKIYCEPHYQAEYV